MASVLYVFFFLAVTGYVLQRLDKRRSARTVWVMLILVFLLTSTRFLPRSVVRVMEDTYQVFDPQTFPANQLPTYVHVLGAGYANDALLPANAQLEHVTLGRLTEGIRIARQLPNSTLVTSGHSAFGLESQAWVAKHAAIALGFDSSRIEMLESPRTTYEEARALREKFGNNIHVIVVTDALHMPRAFRLFQSQGLSVFAAPANFIVKGGPDKGGLKWLPSVKNLSLSDRLLHELLGNIKAVVYNY